MKNLEIHHARSLTDLRSRIVRCDSSITKLNSLINQSNNAIKIQNENIENLEKKLLESFHNIELKVIFFNNLKNASIYYFNFTNFIYVVYT